jgi:hypothetical protein
MYHLSAQTLGIADYLLVACLVYLFMPWKLR